MDLTIDCSFNPEFWPISRELYPFFFQPIGDLSPFQITLKNFMKISKKIHVHVDKRLLFMVEDQAEKVGVDVDTVPIFPALVVKPILVEDIQDEDMERIEKNPRAVIFDRSGKILAYYSKDSKVPNEGNFIKVDVKTFELEDFPGTLKGKGDIDLGHYLVISDVDDVKVVVTDDTAIITRGKNLAKLFEKFAFGDRKKVHRTAYRPWGSYTVLEDAPDHKVKRITVLPKKRLSLQLHRRRSERWTVIRGTARVTLGNDVIDLSVGESVFIPVETPHRLENPSDEGLVEIIEVQVGDYFGEDDIIRLQDDFGRGNEV